MTSELAVANYTTDRDLLKKQNFHPNLVLASPQSQIVTEGKCKPNHYYLNQDLGPTVDIVTIAHRWHALLLENKYKKMESFDLNTPIFQEIMELAQRRRWPENDARWGKSWLTWLPDYKCFGVFHPNTQASRPSTAIMVTIFTPPKDREARDKNYPFTTYFKLKTDTWTNKTGVSYKVPVAEPQELIPAVLPSEEETAKALELFFDPVKHEPKIKLMDKNAPAR